MKIRSGLFFILFFQLQAGYSQFMETIDSIDINRFSGLWYEIALYPTGLRNGCHCTTNEFEYIWGNKFITATVRCILYKKGRSVMSVRKARVLPLNDNMKLLIRWKWLMREQYDIIGLASDYNWAVIVNTDKNHLFILCRDPLIPSNKYNTILNLISSKGYNTSRLVKTPQNCDIIE